MLYALICSIQWIQEERRFVPVLAEDLSEPPAPRGMGESRRASEVSAGGRFYGGGPGHRPQTFRYVPIRNYSVCPIVNEGKCTVSYNKGIFSSMW